MDNITFEIDEACMKLEQVKFLLNEINEASGNKCQTEGSLKLYELETMKSLVNMFANIATDIVVQVCTSLEQVTC